jgi:hypothetical protein
MPPHHSVGFEFPHRMNKDGTTDSICPRCFTTVGRSTWEADLDRMEAAHSCDPVRLASFSQHRRMPVVSERLTDLRVPDRASIPMRTASSQERLTSRRPA